MLARLFNQSEGMTPHWVEGDDELSGALLLAGMAESDASGRYCFQTTYVDESYPEYLQYKGDFQMIWVLRNPYSTVFSLAYNWPSEALNRTFEQAVLPGMAGLRGRFYRTIGGARIESLEKACALYSWKLAQLSILRKALGRENILVVDYDALVTEKETLLPFLYRFARLRYKPEYGEYIHTRSVGKRNALTRREQRIVERRCERVYQESAALVDVPGRARKTLW